MKLLLITVLATPFILGCGGNGTEEPAAEDMDLAAKARELAQRFIIVDTHVDVPYRLQDEWEDISQRTEGGDFDYVRAKEGGLDAAFMSIYVPASYQDGRAKNLADQLIDMVEKFEQDWPDKFTVAHSVQEVRDNFSEGLISLPMGMENGAPIEGSMKNLKHFYDRGIRYITLTHSRVNHISDSSYDRQRKWKGLSPFGKKLVAEMNRLGIMIDVSHISDAAFDQVIQLTQAPPIASHSSCRHFTPGWERNMSDDMIGRLAEKGGVIQIAWGSPFISNEYRLRGEEMRNQIAAQLKERNLTRNSEEGRQLIQQYRQEHPLPEVTVADVADHIDHVTQLVGVDHVGFGSDFDGVDGNLPTDLRDVSQYPNLIRELLSRGYSEEDIEKICSGNLLRVWSEVEETAARMQEGS